MGLVVALTFAALAAAPPVTFGDTLADRQAEADQIEAELVQLDSDLEHAIESYNEANARLEQTEQRIDENTTRLEITRNNLSVAQQELNQALVNAYMHGETDIVQVMLSAESLSAVLDEVSLLNRATSHSADVLSRIRQYKVEVKERQADLEKEQAARKQAVADKEARRQAVEQGLAARQARLGSVKAEILDIIEQRAAAERAAAEARARQAAAALGQASAVAAQTPSPDIGGAAGASDDGGGASGGGDDGSSGGGGTTTVPAPPPASGVGASAAGVAMGQLGTPYVWAGAAPGGFDCSGLVMWAFAQVGVSLPHNAAAQYGVGSPVDRASLQPGDLVFFSGLGHVGIYIGGGQYVHAPQTGDVVKVSSMDRSGYVGARRVA